jgi:DNA polymerase-1
MPVTLLLDADIFAFAIAATSQKAFKWEGDDGPVSLHVDDWEDVYPRVDEAFANVKAHLKADELIVCLSCKTEDGFRFGIHQDYKQNRKGAARPFYLQPLKEYMAEKYRTYWKETLEADDCMGILSTHPTLIPGKKITVSEDKDMQCIPGWLYNPAKDTKPRLISDDQADYFHMYQTLVGDATDNYKGCPGIGPVKAEKLLKEAHPADLWDIVVGAYEAKGLTEDDALLQAQLARICRHTEYDFKTQKVILWNP